MTDRLGSDEEEWSGVGCPFPKQRYFSDDLIVLGGHAFDSRRGEFARKFQERCCFAT